MRMHIQTPFDNQIIMRPSSRRRSTPFRLFEELEGVVLVSWLAGGGRLALAYAAELAHRRARHVPHLLPEAAEDLRDGAAERLRVGHDTLARLQREALEQVG